MHFSTSWTNVLNGTFPGKSWKKGFLSPGKPWIWYLQVLENPGKKHLNVCRNPVLELGSQVNCQFIECAFITKQYDLLTCLLYWFNTIILLCVCADCDDGITAAGNSGTCEYSEHDCSVADLLTCRCKWRSWKERLNSRCQLAYCSPSIITHIHVVML